MATTRVILRRSKANQKGLAPLYLRITYQHKSDYVSLKRNVRIKNGPLKGIKNNLIMDRRKSV